MSQPFTSLLAAVGIAVVALLLPWLASSAAVRHAQRSGHLVTNWRGRPVARVLGVAWAAWGAGVAIGVIVLGIAETGRSYVWSPSVLLDMAPALLVLGVAALGFIDDRFGTQKDRGFAGHLRALRNGRITTGLVKMAGIALLALFAGWALVLPAVAGASYVSGLVMSALIVALAANFVNLTDRRPGRALKTYMLLILIGSAVLVAPLASRVIFGRGADLPGILAAVVLFLGPALVVWRYDLTERAMLGDAGANAAGALGGWFLAYTLPPNLLGIAAAVLLGLNLASEQVSFSEVIEENRVLSWLDHLGRLPDGDEPRGPEPEGQ